MKDILDAIILGAGASGLMAAISAGQEGKKVLVLERNERPGNKILISGGGRCNFTNLVVTPQHFVSANPHFCKSALAQFDQGKFIQWVQDANIEYYEKTLGQLFCKISSKQILNMLLGKIQANGVTCMTNVLVDAVKKEDEYFEVKTTKGSFCSRNLVVATGGLSLPKLGATDLGYVLAQQFGHKVTPLRPALDGFVLSEEDMVIMQGLAGVSFEARLRVGAQTFCEPLLLTHVGLSGPVALKASLYWNSGDSLIIDFLPHHGNLVDWLNQQRKTQGKKLIVNLIGKLLNQRFVESCFTYLDLRHLKLADASKNDLQKIEGLFKRFTIIPQSTVGYAKAEVTRGGVNTHQLSSQSMESKIVKGLFFVGEVVDVTGLLGGYNFQWAWSSGWVAGKSLS